MEFKEFPKIGRLSREIVITEKIDGTNAQIAIVSAHDLRGQGTERIAVARAEHLIMLAGSRSQFITPERDNHGFARWVEANAAELWQLGEGCHYGEWWGSGIQRGYGLVKGDKRFSLFNVHRWADVPPEGQSARPACCSVVPELYRGPFSTQAIDAALEELRCQGSRASYGFMNPEGIVIFHTAAGTLFKKTIEKDAEHKSVQRVPSAAAL